VRRLYELKGRPAERPAAVMFFSLSSAPPGAPRDRPRERAALGALLPGPITLLLPNRSHRFPLACGPGEGDADTLGLRVPAWPASLEALAQGGCSGALNRAPTSPASPTPGSLHDVRESIRTGADLLLDGVRLPGVPSTVLDLRDYERRSEWRVVREGPLTRRDLERVLAS